MKKNSVSRRDFLAASGASLTAGLTAAKAAGGNSPADRTKKPNLVFFMPDELRAESVACYGNPVVKTPNMDRLAREGVRFSHCYVQNPVCGPSRCSLMTGWPVHVHGHRSLYYFLRPDEPNLFRYLKQNGYDVFWYGKNDLLASQSFADSVTEWGSHPGRGRPSSGTRDPWPLDDPHYYSFLYEEGGDRRDYADWGNVQAGIKILERQHDKPFCIFLPLSSPHPPYTAPQGFHNMYDPAKLPQLRPIGLFGKPNFYKAIRKSYHLDPLGEDVFRKIQSVYLGKVSYTDWLLGELLEAIERTGHLNDTAVFLLSDHGDWAGDYGLVEKWPSAMDDVLTHIPLIVRLPGGSQGHVSQEIVELFDVMATSLELAGIEAGHTHFARSLAPQLHGEAGDPGRAAFSEGGYNIYEPQCFEPGDLKPPAIYYHKEKLEIDQPETVCRATMIKTPEHKLVVRPGAQSELYDVAKDPRELHNVYGDRSYASVQEGLMERLLHWYVLTADVAPRDKDPRGSPPFYPTAHFDKDDWQRKILD
jgi:arylsulfatase A-like enzyme